MPDPRPPMSYADVALILERAMRDQEYMDKLIENPKETLQGELFGPGDATIAFFRSLGTLTFKNATDEYRTAREQAAQADMEV